MAYEVVMSYHLHMPSYFLGTFTEYPYLNSTCIRIRLLQLPNIRKKFMNIFPGVLCQIIWKFGYDIIQPFPWVTFLCFTGS